MPPKQPKCPFRRLSNGEWVNEAISFDPVPFGFFKYAMIIKPKHWRGKMRKLHALRRLAYEGCTESVRILSGLEGSDAQKNSTLEAMVADGSAQRLGETLEFCSSVITEIAQNAEQDHLAKKHRLSVH